MRAKVKCRSSPYPAHMGGVVELLNELCVKLDTLTGLVEGEAKESAKRYERIQNCIYHLQNRKGD